MLLKKCANKIRGARKKESQGNKQPGMDLGECVGNKVRRNLPELPNTRFTVMIRWVSNGKNFGLAPNHL